MPSRHPVQCSRRSTSSTTPTSTAATTRIRLPQTVAAPVWPTANRPPIPRQRPAVPRKTVVVGGGGASSKPGERPELTGLNGSSGKATTTTQTSPTEESTAKAVAAVVADTGAGDLTVPPTTTPQVNGNNNDPPAHPVAGAKEGGKQPKELPTSNSNAEAAAEAAANNGNSIEEHKQKKLGNDTKTETLRISDPKDTTTDTVTQHLVTSTNTDTDTDTDTDKLDATKSDTDTITKTSQSTVTNTSQSIRPIVNRHSGNKANKNPFEEDDDRIYEVPADANTADLPAGVLYRVKATYGYVKEDVDELSFEIGDIIRVIEYDDPEDQFFVTNLQEEGWLMGQKEGTTEKGLFPANFTRPI
ncbi:uncharacterized protein Dana_GF13397, isoform B [Drosophila ananassae]|uniref:Uncharacterized protein, isoform B n=1 Tax=Drosophila ananassae TaxID=7217 RepID=A0A0P9BZH8_DROAN|nr:uncharacterized protein Dana_GF13397, isoform B [Drosophila ananassae]